MSGTLLRAAAMIAAAAVARDVAAQSQRSFAVSRSMRDSAALAVRVNYDAGHLELRPGAAATLYDVRLQYDAGGSAPEYAYSADTRTLRVGASKLTGNFPGPKSHEGDTLRVALSPRAPLDLSLQLGATEAGVDLSGLRVRSVKIESGASEATVRFDSANVERMSLLDLQAGVAKLNVIGLGNANVEEVRVRAGVGSVVLDFAGAWQHDADLALDVALGSVTLRVPAGVGIRLEMNRSLTGVSAPGLHREGSVWVSDGWATATRKLRIRAHTTLGRLTVQRT